MLEQAPNVVDLARRIEERFGVVLSATRTATLRAAVEASQRIGGAPLTSGETCLFRYPRHFEALAELARERALGNRSLFVLSAGCSTGEEAWSAAAVLDVAFDSRGSWRVEGWDLDDERLRAAAKGQFEEWSTRRSLMGYERCFAPFGDGLQVADRLRSRTTFRAVNLATSECLGEVSPDVIFFCNVGIYWRRDRAQRVVDALAARLPDHGLLLLGGADPWPTSPEWHAEVTGEGVVCRKAPSPRQPLVEPRVPSVVASPAPVQPVELPPAASQPEDASLSLEARFLTGVLHLERGESKAAERCFRQCVFLAPQDPTYRQWLMLARGTPGGG